MGTFGCFDKLYYLMIDQSENLLTFTRLGIGHPANSIEQSVDWPALKNIADHQGLSAIVLDGLNALLNSHSQLSSLNSQLKLSWIGEVLQNYEQRYERCRKTIGKLAKFYNDHGFKLMVLKGYGLSLNYPKPNHRPCGDIDIWAFGQYREADTAISKELSIQIEHDHHHHTVFEFEGFTVENHYDFLNVHYGHRNAELEKVLKDLAMDDRFSTPIEGQKVYLPSPNLHALFILRHMMHNFSATSMNLRQVLDWAFFVEKNTGEIDWEWLLMVLDEYHMLEFFNILNAICVDDLGFGADIFPSVQFLPDIKARVLNDIISPEFGGTTPQNIFKRAIFKYRRWQANAWKQDLCYGDSRYRSLFEGVWSHLLKPASI